MSFEGFQNWSSIEEIWCFVFCLFLPRIWFFLDLWNKTHDFSMIRPYLVRSFSIRVHEKCAPPNFLLRLMSYSQLIRSVTALFSNTTIVNVCSLVKVSTCILRLIFSTQNTNDSNSKREMSPLNAQKNFKIENYMKVIEILQLQYIGYFSGMFLSIVHIRTIQRRIIKVNFTISFNSLIIPEWIKSVQKSSKRRRFLHLIIRAQAAIFVLRMRVTAHFRCTNWISLCALIGLKY